MLRQQRSAESVRPISQGLVRFVSMVVAGLTALLGLTATRASASPPVDKLDEVEAASHASEALRNALGRAFGGYWLDDSGTPTVGVTSPGDFGRARALGAEPRLVGRSLADLDAAKGRLDEVSASATVPASVTGWFVDLPTNSVVVSSLNPDDPATIEFAAAAGPEARVEQVGEAPVPYWGIVGGQAILTGSGVRCSAGFNAYSGSTRYLITAGHCTNVGTTWSGSGGTIGTVSGSSFPTNDYGIIKVTSSAATSTPQVDRYSAGADMTVKGSVPAVVGASVCRSGSTTGWKCGKVLALNQTVHYSQGTVYGLTKTNACAEPGDSGGAFVTYSASTGKGQAQGLTSGGSGNCYSGGIVFFQPVNEVLSAYGLSLYVG